MLELVEKELVEEAAVVRAVLEEFAEREAGVEGVEDGEERGLDFVA